MDCPLRSGHDLAEAYVAGTLPESDQSAFEEHFFACTACFAQVQLLQQVADGLRTRSARAPRPVAANHGPPHVHQRPRPAAWRPSPWIGFAAVAALLVAASVTWFNSSGPVQVVFRPLPGTSASTPVEAPSTGAPPPGSSAPAPAPGPAAPAPPDLRQALQQLAMVVPPRYVPLAVRSGEAPPAGAFDRAMAHYVAGRHAEAAQGLGTLAAEHPGDPGVAFFLGISELVRGRPGAAREALGRAVSLGIQPYADEARFYLAKAALADGDVAAARRELAAAIERDAGPEGEAARTLAALDRLPVR